MRFLTPRSSLFVYVVSSIAPCAIALAAFAAPSASAKNKNSQAAQALLDKAVKVTDIQAAGGQPFLLIAKTSWTQYGKTTNGQFALAWESASHYRREITLPGFVEAIVTEGGTLYRTRNVDFVPLAALRSASLLEVSQAFKNWPTNEMKIDEQPPTRLGGASDFRCISAVTEFPRSSVRHVACFDNTKGVPLIEQERLPSAESTVTFSGYIQLNDNLFPRVIRYDDTAGVHGAVEVVKLEAVANFPQKTFEPPARSIEQAWCTDPKVTQPEHSPAQDNWLRWEPGPIVALDDPLVFMSVSAKGAAQNVVLLDESAGKLEKMAASRMWKGRFAVETCGKTSIPYETVIHLMRMQPNE